MWNDEDNNPYGTSFARADLSPTGHPSSPESQGYPRYDTPATPTSTTDSEPIQDTLGRNAESDEEDAARDLGEMAPRRKPGGYDSRIEQILYENPELPILITDAGKSPDSGGRYIVYTIRTDDLEAAPDARHPPIPEKHTMADYAANPTNAKQDQAIIDLRKRMLAVFLNRCRRMEQVRTDGVWWRFLDPNASWSEVLNSHPIAPFLPSHSRELVKVEVRHSKRQPDPGVRSVLRRELEQLLTGPIEKVNRRTLSHLSSLAADLCELGSRFNAFALSEQSQTLGAAIERIGQAADSSYIATEELSSTLGANFAEPMRENAQFAGVVKNVLRYRVLKRVQQDMTTDELNKKRALLDQLEHSEAEARRIEQYLSGSQTITSPPATIRDPGPRGATLAGSAPVHKKMPSGNSITNKIFGPIRHAIQGVADVDPERTRRDLIGKTRESIGHLEQAQVASAQDVKDASASTLQDLKRFQREKEDDLRRYMLAYARSQVEWAKKNKETWEEARDEVDKIEMD
ncbi:unnamed protein product [Parascedosporium putredinis]|uniref:Sorting nexin-41 n=1 Tax=Parascedosporium putredinis TaxID=1442378 RepID=A0A9P1HCF4_9PEZI|nr:unnamed protein product [Parascedosporium putredinis]CAI8003219.1 unnamed protein product [Parascedosporium putredinis]